MQVAQDKAPTKLLFKKLETVSGWQEIVVIALGDQARNNRPDGGSTGGLTSFLGGPGHLQGRPGPLSLVHPAGWGVLQFRRTTRPHPM